MLYLKNYYQKGNVPDRMLVLEGVIIIRREKTGFSDFLKAGRAVSKTGKRNKRGCEGNSERNVESPIP